MLPFWILFTVTAVFLAIMFYLKASKELLKTQTEIELT